MSVFVSLLSGFILILLFYCVCVCYSPLSIILYWLFFLVSNLVLKNTIKILLLSNVLCLHTIQIEERQTENIVLYENPDSSTPRRHPLRLHSQWCASWPIQWKSTYTIDVCPNVKSMQLYRKDSAEEVGADWISTHKSQHI